MARHSSTESKESPNTGAPQKIPVVGIGASAGGLEAFKAFFGKMPADTGMAFVLIPHLDPGHKSLMGEIIGRHSAMPAAHVEKRMAIAPNHIYIVPPNRNLTIEGGRLVPYEISRQQRINLPVDFFFRSLAAARNERAIGVILSGTMSDGAMGVKDIKEHGGLVIAQIPETAQHDGMPRSAIDTGMVDLTLPVEEIPDAIVKFITHPYIHGDAHPPRLMQTQLLKRFAPPSVLINKKYEIVNLYGPTENFLQMPRYDPVMDLMSMIREGLRVKMRAAVHKAVKNNETVTVSKARVERDGRFHPVRFTVSPVHEKDVHDAFFLITFEPDPSSTPDAAGQTDLAGGEGPLVKQLEAELMTTREDLQNTIEELETANEELKASNEEMMSMNEELNTVNAELREKIEEVESSNNDLVNLMDSTEIAVIFLNVDSTVRRFTPSAKKLFNLIPSDVGRPIGDLSRRFSDDDLADHARQVMETLAPMTKQVKTDAGRWFIRRILPFRTQDNRVDGLVLTFADVTQIKAVESELRASEREFWNLAENIPGLALKYKLNPDGDDELLYISKGVEDLFEVSREEVLNNNALLWDRIHKDDLEEYVASIKESAQNLSFWEQEHRLQLPDGRIKWVHARGVPSQQEDGGVLWDSLAVDITGRKKAEEDLREAHAFLQQIIDNSLALIVAKNRKGEYILANHISARLLGCQKHDMIGKTDADLFPKETADRLAEDDGKVFETGESLHTEEQIQIGDRNYTFATTKFPLLDANGEVYAICAMATDITERKRMESELENSKNLLEATGRMARVGGWTLEPETSAVGWTQETYRIHEVPIDHRPPLEEALAFYPPEGREPLTRAIQRAMDNGEPYDLEIPFVTATGKPLWVRTICRPEVIDGKTVKLSGTFQDITKRKNAELALQKALAEKETLLREIHHRVKNNMQVIVGLLRMHARRTDNPDLTKAFDDCRDRIEAMSLVHEALYQSDDLACIDFAAYLKKLCRNLGQAHDARRKGITLTTSAADVSLDMDQGVAVGMIIAELISNAFKHAFPHNEGGTVSVHLDRPDGETVRLIVSDTGGGPPDDFDIHNPASLGMRLVSGAVTRELGGTIDVERDNGTRFIIRFK